MTISAPRLLIRKRMQFIQGRVRACCHMQAVVASDIKAVLDEHFLNEPLFKRAFYATNWPQGAIPIPAALAPAMGSLLKSDACPEITVKTMLAGQLHLSTSVWDMLSFELVAKLAFDNFLAVAVAAGELNRDLVYCGQSIPLLDVAQMDADTAAELRALVRPNIAA